MGVGGLRHRRAKHATEVTGPVQSPGLTWLTISLILALMGQSPWPEPGPSTPDPIYFRKDFVEVGAAILTPRCRGRIVCGRDT